jgi:uncharacterized protein
MTEPPAAPHTPHEPSAHSPPSPVAVDVGFTVATAVHPSPHVLAVATMFGLGLDDRRVMPVVPSARLELHGGQVVFVTGPSGGGKSSLLRCLSDALANRPGVHVIHFDRLPDPPPDRSLVDCFDGLPLRRVMAVLSLAGLNDAFVMLRRPDELSDGQRYRFRLARTLAMVESAAPPSFPGGLYIVLADEFGATLDRVTAHVIARNVRKWTRRAGNVSFIAATTHDDLLEPLEPDVLVHKGFGERMDVVTRSETS